MLEVSPCTTLHTRVGAVQPPRGSMARLSLLVLFLGCLLRAAVVGAVRGVSVKRALGLKPKKKPRNDEDSHLLEFEAVEASSCEVNRSFTTPCLMCNIQRPISAVLLLEVDVLCHTQRTCYCLQNRSCSMQLCQCRCCFKLSLDERPLTLLMRLAAAAAAAPLCKKPAVSSGHGASHRAAGGGDAVAREESASGGKGSRGD